MIGGTANLDQTRPEHHRASSFNLTWNLHTVAVSNQLSAGIPELYITRFNVWLPGRPLQSYQCLEDEGHGSGVDPYVKPNATAFK